MNEAPALVSLLEKEDIGQAIYSLAAEIFPICRSITGDGVRRTIDVLGRHFPIERHEIPTGTAVLDWEVPRASVSLIFIGAICMCSITARRSGVGCRSRS
jgi:hypothetical protein